MSNRRDLDHAATAGAFIPVGHSLELPALPDLSASRFTDLDQRSEPGAPRTRLIKDVLRVGRWHYTDDNGQDAVWDVTEQTLHELANNFARYQQGGNASNWIWGHSDDNRDAIQPVDQLLVANGTLWASGYFTPEQAADLSNPARKVSVRVVENWTDGNGQQYSQLPLHIGVVEVPVVSGQGPFRQLSTAKQRAIALSLLRPSSSRKDLGMDFETIKSGFNELFDGLGLDVVIPDHVTDEDTFDMWIKDAVSFVTGKSTSGEEEMTQPGNPGTVEETLPEGAVAASAAGKGITATDLSNAVKAAVAPLVTQLSSVQSELKEIKAEKTNAAKEEYESRVKELGQAGLPGKEAHRLLSLGQSYGYDLNLLAGAEHHPQIDMGRIAKTHRNGSAPELPHRNGRLSDDEIKEQLKKRGKNPDKMPVFER